MLRACVDGITIKGNLGQIYLFRKKTQVLLIALHRKDKTGQKIQIARVFAVHALDTTRPFTERFHRIIARLIAQEIPTQTGMFFYLFRSFLGSRFQFRTHENRLHSHLSTEIKSLNGIVVRVDMRERIVKTRITHLLIMLKRSMFAGRNAVPA